MLVFKQYQFYLYKLSISKNRYSKVQVGAIFRFCKITQNAFKILYLATILPDGFDNT
jgi:hypothetical protein